jgi:hypothetical protein
MVGSGKWSFGLLALSLLWGSACGSAENDPPSANTGGKSAGTTGGAAGTASSGGNALTGGSATGGSDGTQSGGSATGGVSASGGASGEASGGSSGEAGGGGESGGDGGAGGAPDIDLQPVGNIPADKIDLLFVVDNSISMADKQEILKSALPILVRRLATPVCVDAAGTANGQHANASGVCASGQPEFPPIRDFHIGVITSSLGAHGGQTCTDADDDDKSRLLPSVRSGLRSWNDSGFLAWDPEGTRNQPAGENDANRLVDDFASMVVAAGEAGCGFESTLESWYRFLVDSAPPSSVTMHTDYSGVDLGPADAIVLEQRAKFLRPDSLLGIVLFTDENDCSIMDGGQGFLVGMQTLGGSAFRAFRSTSACAVDPNDPCCNSCASAARSGCPDPATDSACVAGGKNLTATEDSLNLRCWDQKRRFGVDFLYPISRYVDGLTKSEVLDHAGLPAENPIFQAPPGKMRRDPSRVFLLGIVGVPWQDLADSQSLKDPRRLRYLSYDELEAGDRFSLVLGENGAPPRDSLMFETTADRSAMPAHPLTGDVLAPASALSPQQNPINGHESITGEYDLQYACIFPLKAPRNCSDSTGTVACDCHPEDVMYARPLCQPPAGGAAGTTQYYAKAYPSARHLELIRAFGKVTGNSVAASICPKVADASMPSTDANYGYNPAVTALVDRMKSALAPACLSTPLKVDANGAVSCDVLEVSGGGGACSCALPGHREPSRSSVTALRARLQASLYCGGPGQPSCESLCVCALDQLATADLPSCQNDAAVAAGLAGFCYVDADQKLGNADLVDSCPVDRKRRLRFVGTDVPRAASSTYVLCPP